jgi:polar amino acid transport system substrate-binding protein
MRTGILPRLLQSFSLACLCAAPALARAGCSRPILIPSAPVGLSVLVRGNEVSGIFPEFLRQVGATISCDLVWSAAPRARIEVLFAKGGADILMPATSSAARDELGVFVPVLDTRAFAVALASDRPPLENMEQLLARRDLRVAMVRGFDYGPAYQKLAEQLAKQGRLRLESNPGSVVRLLQDGLSDVAILTPITVYGAIKTDARLQGMEARVRFEALPELQWHPSGIYLSRKLPAADLALLEKGIRDAAGNGLLVQAYKRTYPSHIISLGTRPASTGALPATP